MVLQEIFTAANCVKGPAAAESGRQQAGQKQAL